MPSLLATLGLNTTPFKRNLAEAQQTARHAGNEFAGAFKEFSLSKLGLAGGAAGLATGVIVGLESMREHVIETVEHIHELSKEFRVSTDTIQIWEKGARRVGMTADDIGNAFNRLKKARAAAASSGDIGGFAEFGIGMKDLRDASITTEQIMDRMRAAVGTEPITDAEDVAGMELMGKSGAKVLSAMNEIAQLGPVNLISEEQIDELAEAQRQLKEISAQMTIMEASGLSAIAAPSKGLMGFLGRGSAAVEALIRTKSLQTAMQLMMDSGVLDDPGRKGIKKKPEHSHREIIDAQKKRNELADRIAESELKGLDLAARRVRLEELITAYKQRAAEYEKQGEGSLANSANEQAERFSAELVAANRENDAQILRLSQETARIKEDTAEGEMTSGERVLRIQERIAKVKAEIADSIDDLDEAQSQKNLAELERDLMHAKKAAAQDDGKDEREETTTRLSRRFNPDVNSNQRIGAFASMSASVSLQKVTERSERHLAALVQEAKKQTRVTDRGGTKY
jgi:hypothetical protein